LQTGITLTVGEQQVLNFTLQVGQIAQTVEVSTEAPTVELASSSISATVNSTTVRELPLNGRSWTDLAALQPGVSAITTQTDFAVGGDRGNRGFGNQITVAGDRPEQNNYRLDGSVSMISTTPLREAYWAATWEWMPSRSFPSSPATFPLSTAGPQEA